MRTADREMARMLSFLMRDEFPTAMAGPPMISTDTSGCSCRIWEADASRKASRRELFSVSELPKGESIRTTARLMSGVKM